MKKALLMALALLFTISTSTLVMAGTSGSSPKHLKKSHKKHHYKKKKGHASSMPTPAAK